MERNMPTSAALSPQFNTPLEPARNPLISRFLPLAGALVASVGFGVIAGLFDSYIAIGIIILAGLVVTALLRPEMTTVFISFAFYANLPVVAIRYGNVPPAIAGAIFLALGLPMLHALVVRRERIVVNAPFILMTAYIAVLLLSAVLSRNFEMSYDRILSYLIEGYILYFLFLNTIWTPETLKKVIWAVILAGAFVGTLSIIQEVTGDFENEFFGLAQTKDAELTVGAEDFFGTKETTRRLAGPIGSKNRYAQIMVVLLPLAIMQIFASRRLLYKYIAAATLIPIVAGTLLTYSRGAGLTLVAILIAMMLLRVLPVWKTILYGALAYLLILIFLPSFAYRFASVVDVAALFGDNVDEADGAIRGRATVNLVGIQIMLQNPVLGVGPGQSPLYTREIGNEIGFRYLETDRRLHNMFLEEAADTGLIGLTVFLGIVAVTLKQLNDVRVKWREKRPEYYYIAVGLILAIFAYLAMAVFLHLSYVRYYWFLLALAGAGARILLNQPEPAESPQGQSS
jgi:putative inorganic carbon (HCO3(-)) transporter